MVSIEADYLKQLVSIDLNHDKQPLSRIFSGKPFLYEEMVTPRIHALVDELTQKQKNEDLLDLFFYQIKAFELIYLFLNEFAKRELVPLIPINKQDMNAIYQVRDHVLQDSSVPPLLADLSQKAAMSDSKMKKLFKQVFGIGVYEYYQDARMKKAARLLSLEHYSVTQTGYALGFSNLSHFGRLFEKHFGMKPKKYSISK